MTEVLKKENIKQHQKNIDAINQEILNAQGMTDTNVFNNSGGIFKTQEAVVTKLKNDLIKEKAGLSKLLQQGGKKKLKKNRKSRKSKRSKRSRKSKKNKVFT